MSFNTKTKSPTKQRNKIKKASSFHRHKLMNVRLSKDLRKKYNVKRMPVRKGDTVYVTAGDFVGTEGKVSTANYQTQKLLIDGIAREKADKSKIMYPIHVSKVVISKFTKEKKMDPWRASMIDRKAVFGFADEELEAPKKQKDEEAI